MDIALILWLYILYNKKEICFNPYFNGYCSYTRKKVVIMHNHYCFNPYFNGYCSYTLFSISCILYCYHVSILILMDIALIQEEFSREDKLEWCFNPYFNGYCSYTERGVIYDEWRNLFQSLF